MGQKSKGIFSIFNRAEWFVIRHFLTSGKGHGFVGVCFWTFVLTVIVFMLVVCVMSGFHHLLTEKMVAGDFHVKISGMSNMDWRVIQVELSKEPHVQVVVPFFEREALMRRKWGGRWVSVKAKSFDWEMLRQHVLFFKHFRVVDSLHGLEFHNSARKEEIKRNRVLLRDLLHLGYWSNDSRQNNKSEMNLHLSSKLGRDIVIGEVLRDELALYPGDLMEMRIPKGDLYYDFEPDSVLLGRVRQVYAADLASLNRDFVFLSMQAVEKVFRFSKPVFNFVGLVLDSVDSSKKVAESVRIRYPMLRIESVADQSWHQELSREKHLIWFFALFLSFVSFGIISLAMYFGAGMREKNLAVLKVLGFSLQSLQRILWLEAGLVSWAGSCVGLVISFVVLDNMFFLMNFFESCVNVTRWVLSHSFWEHEHFPNFRILDPNVFYLDRFPYKIFLGFVGVLMGWIVPVGMWAARLATVKVTKKNVVEMKKTWIGF